jgi:hypothetical protein
MILHVLNHLSLSGLNFEIRKLLFNAIHLHIDAKLIR